MEFPKFLKIFKKQKKEGCPVCYEKNILGFGIDYLNDKFISLIKENDKFGDTVIYKCEKCNTNFFINESTYEKVIDGQISLLRLWSEKKLVCPNKLKEKIEKIGLSNTYDNSKVIPCKIKHKNGKEFEFTTVRFTNKPPLGFYYSNFENIFFIDDIETIESSIFGVSQEIRKVAENAVERRMSFYPTILKTKENVKVVLNGISLFFSAENIKGSDLILANEEWNDRNDYIYDINNQEKTTLVIAKE